MDTDTEQSTDEGDYGYDVGSGHGLEDGGDQGWAGGDLWGGDKGTLGQQDHANYDQQAYGTHFQDSDGYDQPEYAGQGATFVAPPDAPSLVENDGPYTEVKPDYPDYLWEPVKKQARAAFPDELDTFANLWLTAATDALTGAPEPDDEEEGQIHWWLALAGNLVWAATCVVPEGHAVAVAIMSFGGAIAGSDPAGQIHPQKAPSGKKSMSVLLTKARDALVASAEPIMDDAAVECADNQITDHMEQKKVLWRRLFATPFNQSDPIRAEMAVKIEAGLTEYLQQWHAWKDETEREGIAKASFIANIADSIIEVRNEKPFTPHLAFGA